MFFFSIPVIIYIIYGMNNGDKAVIQKRIKIRGKDFAVKQN